VYIPTNMDNIKIIGITGKKFSGKDTLGNYFVEKYGFEKIAYADTLKEAVRVIFDFDDEQLYGNKKEILDDFWKITPRQALQFIGTDLFRNHIHELIPDIKKDIWIWVVKRKIASQLKKNPNKKFVITDIRFPDELQAVKDLGGITIKIQRDNISCDAHESEILIDNLETEYVFVNNKTKDDLYKCVIDVLNTKKI